MSRYDRQTRSYTAAIMTIASKYARSDRFHDRTRSGTSDDFPLYASSTLFARFLPSSWCSLHLDCSLCFLPTIIQHSGLVVRCSLVYANLLSRLQANRLFVLAGLANCFKNICCSLSLLPPTVFTVVLHRCSVCCQRKSQVSSQGVTKQTRKKC